ncbi:hypothetical protein [Teredinibacter haidensis]|uniref:hypothetical protein n=1 Tax=Teredinibacter haidensis TaxID=2731755 RepID=UPI000948DAD4|nr:hypothetical protein [Teredinibacter haidensis]
MNSPPAPPKDSLSPTALFYLLVLAVLLMGFNAMSHLSGGIGDEDVHRYQINWFINGRYEIFKYVTMLPFYHAVVAFFGKVTGLTSLDGLRFVHMAISASVIPAMVALVRCFYPTEALSRTLLLVFVPFLFPLFFLTYTDLVSLMFVLFMVERAWKEHYVWSAVLALFAVVVRQPNIIWVAFTACLVVLNTAKEMGVGFCVKGSDGNTGLLDWDFLIRVLQRTCFYGVVFALFLAFVVWNGGVAVGDAEQHPISFNLSNLYFFLLVAFVLFLPFNVEQLANIKRLLMANWWILPLLLVLFVVYFYTYEHPHKYNTAALKFYRHNLFIHYTCDYLPWRILSFIPMAWMGLSFVTSIRTSDYAPVLLLMLPFALLSFVPLPLIEQRYYVVALTLFLALRPKMSSLSTGITLWSFVAICAYVMFNITRKVFFL